MGSARQWREYEGTPAENYERYMEPAIFARWAPALLARTRVCPGDRVLDLACGTGVVTRLAAQATGPTGSVAGLDLDPGRLASARKRTLSEVAHAPMTWHEGSATALPFSDHEFDVVVCQQGLQFFPDRLTALCETRRVLRPGGRLGLAVWRSTEFAPGWRSISDALGRHLGAAAAVLSPFALGDGDQLRSLTESAGFSGVEVEAVEGVIVFPSATEFVCQIAAATPSVLGVLPQLASEVREQFLRDVETDLRPYAGAEGVTLPIQSHVVTARA